MRTSASLIHSMHVACFGRVYYATVPGGYRKKSSFTPNRSRGFALVVTLSLMILLTVLAVGLLTLSSIALRSASQDQALATAPANARMSVMLALGELQRQAGGDLRVTARADILAEDNPPLLGVWKSWQGTIMKPAAPSPVDPSPRVRTIAPRRKSVLWPG